MSKLRCFITWRDKRARITRRAEVDPEIFRELRRHAWNAFTTRTAGKTYFRRTASDGVTTILLHREVMRLLGRDPPAPAYPGQRLIVDHENGNEGDCRGRNLRWATYRENNLNRRPRVDEPRETGMRKAA